MVVIASPVQSSKFEVRGSRFGEGRQTKIVLPGECGLCAMTTVAGARDRLPGHDEDDVLALIEETGGLTWAWNIGRVNGETPHAAGLGIAREIRILTKCVEHFAKTGKGLDWTFERVLKEVLRGYKKPFITGTRLQIILNCSSTHIMNLLNSELRTPNAAHRTPNSELRLVPGTSWTTGPAGSPLIVTESFIEFLKARQEI
jgi:hypothetical protein